MWHRRGLVLLLYLFGLVLAVLVGGAVSRLLSVEIGPTGFSERLTERFDIVLWADFWDGLAAGFAAVARQAVLAGVIMMIWKVASSVGLIHALQGDSRLSFWEGVSRFTLRGISLGLLYLLPLLALLAVVVIAFEAAASDMGEVGAFWTRFVVMPLAVIVLAATVDLFHDYARMHLVLRQTKIRRAWLEGIKWPFRHFRSVFLYKIWFWISALLWIAVLLVGFYMPDQTLGAVMAAFVIQQGLIIARSGAYVSWIGAEVAFFERYAPSVPEPEAAEMELMVSDDQVFAAAGGNAEVQ
ncbi:MAG TPA: hypothetical protein VMO47_09310 [Rhodothermales bacterium]|nr:hypothetical protein [Rhodothermales bacterium]